MTLMRKLWDGYSRFITLDWLLHRGVSHNKLLGMILLLGSLYVCVPAYRALVLHIPFLNRYGNLVSGNRLVVGGLESLFVSIALALLGAFLIYADRKSLNGKTFILDSSADSVSQETS